MVPARGARIWHGMSERTAKRASARGKHLLRARRATAIHQWQQRRRSGLGKAVDTLFPWQLATYPGRINGAVAMLQGRVSAPTLKHWLRGNRRAPRWAWALLAIELERRRAELDHALELAKKEAGD